MWGPNGVSAPMTRGVTPGGQPPGECYVFDEFLADSN
jgi:hypothetical protein